MNRDLTFVRIMLDASSAVVSEDLNICHPTIMSSRGRPRPSPAIPSNDHPAGSSSSIRSSAVGREQRRFGASRLCQGPQHYLPVWQICLLANLVAWALFSCRVYRVCKSSPERTLHLNTTLPSRGLSIRNHQILLTALSPYMHFHYS